MDVEKEQYKNVSVDDVRDKMCAVLRMKIRKAAGMEGIDPVSYCASLLTKLDKNF